MSEVKTYLLVVEGSRCDEYGDDHWTVSRLAQLDETDPLLWKMTHGEMMEFHFMFNYNKKYRDFRFVEIVTPGETSVAALNADLDTYRDTMRKRDEARALAEKNRLKTIEEKKLQRARAKIAKDEQMRKKLYEELKQEFKDA